MKSMLTKCVESYRRWDRQRETHCWKPDRMKKENEGRVKKKGIRRWTGMESVQISFPKLFSPFFLLNTPKCAFFPQKSTWTICFCKNIFHWQSHECLYSLIISMVGKRHSFWGNCLRGEGCRGVRTGGFVGTTVLHPQHTWKKNSLWFLNWK